MTDNITKLLLQLGIIAARNPFHLLWFQISSLCTGALSEGRTISHICLQNSVLGDSSKI